MNEEKREAIALFRYGVVAELVNGPLAPGERAKITDRLVSREWTIPGTTRTTLGRSTIRDWADSYRAMGLDGLKPKARSDQGQSRAIPAPVADLLVAMRKERPKASLPSLIRALRLSGRVDGGVRLAPSTVYRLLSERGVEPEPAASRQPDARAFSYPHAGDLWTSDLLHGPRLLVPGRKDGGKTYLYAFLDDATRMVPFAAFYFAENAACFAEAFRQAMLRRGVPRRLYCDNGATYRTHHLSVVCATLNVALIHSRPHQPRGRGKIERFFRTVRSTFLPHVTDAMLTDLGALNRVFWAWLEAEYHHTPHGGLDGQTPIDRFLQDAALIRPAPENLDALMRMKLARKVGRDRTVQLQGRLYEAPDGYAGETVTVLFDPFDPARPVSMCRKGETVEIPLRRLDLHTNATLKRLAREEAPLAPAPATGVSYLDLIADQFYKNGGKS
jgi:transposase InsO family protein